MTLTLTQRAQTSLGEIAWDSFGRGSEVVLVHGTPSRAAVWRHVVPRLAQRHRVFVFDLLGFGDSERHVEQDVSVAVHGRVLAELLDQWALEDPVLVGHDIGGATVLRTHLIEGASVRGMALIDAVVLAPWITPRTRAMQQNLARYQTLPDAQLADTIARHLRTATRHPLSEETFGLLFSQWDGEAGQRLYLRNVASLNEADTDAFEPLLASVAVPVLVVWGEHDAWLPVSTSDRIVSRIPSARRVVLSDAGHFSMEDQPEAVADELVGFVTEL